MTSDTNQKVVVPGPNGTQIIFEHPTYEGEIFSAAYILKHEKHISTLERKSYEGFDAADAQDRFRDKRGGKLWSLDGSYIILVTWRKDEDSNQWDLKHEYIAAYSTTTGKVVTFKSATNSLGNGTFIRWSPTKPDVVIIRGNNGNEEEAHPVIDK